MKAVGFKVAGAIDRADAFLDLEVADPVPAGRDLLVRVEAVSVNPVDAQMRSGANPSGSPERIIGYDAAGTVEAVGPDTSMFKVGDAVYYAGSIMRPGTNSELHLVDERIVGHKPKSASWAEAAALPLTTLTAWELLFDRLRIQQGPEADRGSILVVNGAGGVGSILIQLARQLTGLRVIATASRPETREWVEGLGAHHVIDHSKGLEEELAAIGMPQVNYIASLRATEANLASYAKIIAPQGGLAIIDRVASLDIAAFHPKSATVCFEGMFTRSMFQTPDMALQHDILEAVAGLIDEGTLRSTLTRELGAINAENLKRAHGEIETGRSIGKIVLAGFAA